MVVEIKCALPHIRVIVIHIFSFLFSNLSANSLSALIATIDRQARVFAKRQTVQNAPCLIISLAKGVIYFYGMNYELYTYELI